MAALLIAVNKLPTDVDSGSVMIAAANAASMGLMLGGRYMQAFLIPRKLKGKRVCNLEIGYKGWLELAYQANFLDNIYCDVVLEGEKFSYGANENGFVLRHVPSLERDWSSASLRKSVTHAYCVFKTRTGGRSGFVVSRKQINQIDSGENVWASHFGDMCLKTPVIRAARFWKITRPIGMALELEACAETGREQTAPDEWQAQEKQKPIDFSAFDEVEVTMTETIEATVKVVESQVANPNVQIAQAEEVPF